MAKDFLNTLTNIAGRGLEGLRLIQAIAQGGPQGISQFLQTNARAAQDPSLRQAMGSSGLLSGAFGYGAPDSTPDPASAAPGPYQQAARAMQAQGVNQSMPPLLPGVAAEQAKNTYEEGLWRRAQAGDPQSLSVLGMPLSIDQANQMAANAGVGTPGGPTKFSARTGGGTATYGGTSTATSALLYPDAGSAQAAAHQAGPGVVAIPAGDGTHFRLYHNAKLAAPAAGNPAEAIAALKGLGIDTTAVEKLIGGGSAGAPAAPGGTATAPRVPSPPPAAPTAPQAAPAPDLGYTPLAQMQPGTTVGQFVTPTTKVGYPSPAFGGTSTTTTPATTTTTTTQPVAAQAPGLPPGMSVHLPIPGLKGAAVNITAPKPNKVAAQIIQNVSLVTGATQAAQQALQVLKLGPQSALQLPMLGDTGYRPGSLSGPVTGTGLQALSTVSGQPLAVEASNLEALLSHATSGIYAVTGKRLTEQQLKMFEPMLPNLRQPQPILEAHLHRLAFFYDWLGKQQGALANFSDDQNRIAFAYPVFAQMMNDRALDAQPVPGQTVGAPPIIDLR
jgi:hypothetical protein